MAVNYTFRPQGPGGAVNDREIRRITDWRTDFFDQGPTTKKWQGMQSQGRNERDISTKWQSPRGSEGYTGSTRSGGTNWRAGWQDPRSAMGYWGKHKDYVLDKSRDWKTHWKATRRQDSWNREWSGSDPRSMGWKEGVHYTTGRERSIAHGSGGMVYDKGVNLVEVLDYGAYNKDARYKDAWKAYGGKGKIKSMADILATEEFMTTGITAARKAAQEAADAELERTNAAIDLNRQELDKLQTIDIGGTQVAFDDIGSHINTLLTDKQTKYDESVLDLAEKHDEQIEKLNKNLTNAQMAASYGYGSRTPQVQGVKTQNELTSQQRSKMGIRQNFGRKGQRLTSLNI